MVVCGVVSQFQLDDNNLPNWEDDVLYYLPDTVNHFIIARKTPISHY